MGRFRHIAIGASTAAAVALSLVATPTVAQASPVYARECDSRDMFMRADGRNEPEYFEKEVDLSGSYRLVQQIGNERRIHPKEIELRTGRYEWQTIIDSNMNLPGTDQVGYQIRTQIYNADTDSPQFHHRSQ